MKLVRQLKNWIPNTWKNAFKKGVLGHHEAEEFYRRYFSLPGKKRIIQVGANDGVMSDPLRPFLKEKGDLQAILVEPLPFYSEKLRKLYEGRPEIMIEQVACGASQGERELFFVPPEMADRMNGEGPQNNWAHGQGSFDKKVVEHWIKENAFRGTDYVKNMDRFIAGIVSVTISVMLLKDLSRRLDGTENLLLVMDVQGAEWEVLQGVDWSTPPRFIVLEDDMDRGKKIKNYLGTKGYRFLCGSTDKVFCRKDERFEWA